MSDVDRLAEELRRQARTRARSLPDQHPISLDDVRGRARGIRRRRYAVTGLAAAAVVAVTVPLGIAAGDRLDRSTPTGPAGRPAHGPTQVEDPTPTPTPTPSNLPRRLALTSEVEESSAAPGVPYLAAGVIHQPGGPTVRVDGSYDQLAPLDGGWLVGGDAGGGKRFAAVLDSSGRETERYPALGSIGFAPDGSLAAYVQPAGDRVATVALDGTTRVATVELPPSYQLEEPVRVTAVHPCSAGQDCLFVADVELSGGALAVEVERDRTQRELGYLALADQLPSGVLAVRVLTDVPDATCYAVRPPDGRGWDTCDWRLARFSPDGRTVLAYALGDGRGPRAVALLDARDGTVLREFAARGRADVFVHRAVWEDEHTVLASVWDVDHWSVLRLGLDGSRSRVPVEGLDGADDPDVAPVVLGAPD